MFQMTVTFLERALSPNILLPTIDEWITKSTGAGMDKFVEDKKLLLLLDGTSANIQKPSLHVTGRDMYVQYKKHNAWCYFIATVPNGEIVYLSNFFIGKDDDSKAWCASGLKQTLEDLYNSEDWKGWTLCIGGDKGYVFAEPPEGWEVMLMKTAESELEGSEQTAVPEDGDPQRRLGYVWSMNTNFTIPRSVIERSIDLIKRYKKLYSGSIRLNQGDKFFCGLVVVAVSVANYFI